MVIVLDTKHINAEKSQRQARLSQSQAELVQAINGSRKEELDASRARWIRSQARLKESSASLSRVIGLFKKSATTAEDLDLKRREYEIAQAEEMEALRSFQLVKSGERSERIQYLQAKVQESSYALESINLKLVFLLRSSLINLKARRKSLVLTMIAATILPSSCSY